VLAAIHRYARSGGARARSCTYKPRLAHVVCIPRSMRSHLHRARR